MSQPGNAFIEKLAEKVIEKLKLPTVAKVEEVVKKLTEWGPWTGVGVLEPFVAEGGAGKGEGEEAGQLSVRYIPSQNAGEPGMIQIRGRVNVGASSSLETEIGQIPAEDAKGNKLRPEHFQTFLVAVDALPMAGFTFLPARITPSGNIHVNAEQRGEFEKNTAIYFNAVLSLS